MNIETSHCKSLRLVSCSTISKIQMEPWRQTIRNRNAFSIIRLLLLLLCFSFTSGLQHCDPKDENTCKFMGKCVSITRLKQYNPRLMSKNLHFCTCPKMSCYKLPQKPLCAKVGGETELFYNDMCRRMRECETQRRIETKCWGACGDPSCRPPNKNYHRCPEEKEDYCFNGGLCLISSEGEPYCKCRPKFKGPRCDEKRDLGIMEIQDPSFQNEDGKDVRAS